MRGRLKDKVALVTGAAGGIGRVTVGRFVEEGCRVAIADLDGEAADRLAATLGADAIGLALDIGDEAAFKAAIDATVARWGRLDILFNNAALTDVATQAGDGDVVTVSNEVWERTLHVNVTGCLYGCRHAIGPMAAGGGGSIINMASISAHLGDISRVAYGTSKAAVIALTRYVATAHGRQRVRCNAIAPGPILTPHAREVGGAALLDLLARHAPMGELGEPDDIAALAIYLASDESRYVNGQVITIDGGLTAHHAHSMDLRDHVEGLMAGS